MKSNKKRLSIAILATVMAIVVIIAGAFALFSDYEQGVTNAAAGTVDVLLGELTLSNSDNINPGDEDPNKPDGSEPGTEHELEFIIDNLGNKAADLRTIVIISASGGINNNQLLDPTVLTMPKT